MLYNNRSSNLSSIELYLLYVPGVLSGEGTKLYSQLYNNSFSADAILSNILNIEHLSCFRLLHLYQLAYRGLNLYLKFHILIIVYDLNLK